MEGVRWCDVKKTRDSVFLIIFVVVACSDIAISSCIMVVDPLTSPTTFRSVLATHAAATGDTVSLWLPLCVGTSGTTNNKVSYWTKPGLG